MPISCLIKHAAFEDEDECRIIHTTHIADKLINAPKEYQETSRLYLDYSAVNTYINKIYLGPTCKNEHQQWILNHVESSEEQIKVEKSDVPLR